MNVTQSLAVDLLLYGNAYVCHGERLPPDAMRITRAGYTHRIQTNPDVLVDLGPTEVVHVSLDADGTFWQRPHGEINWGDA